MENTTTQTVNQAPKKITHIKVPISLKKRLDKIRRDSGKRLEVVSKEIIQAGISEYYKNQPNSI